MKINFSLRYRVAFAFLILGWLVSMGLGGTFYWLTLNFEEELIEETLSSELEDYMRRYKIDPNTLPPSSNQIRGYVINGKVPHNLSEELKTLPFGLNHITLEGSGYYVESRKHKTIRFLMLYDDSLIKHRGEKYLGFLAVGVGMMTLLSSFIGFWLAGRVISPVTKLATYVSTMGIDFSSPTQELEYTNDEIGELAQAVEGYHQRLTEYNERERLFTGDISHELRTPLAIIEGATEVMLLNSELSEGNRKIVERIARAAKQITRLTTALLTLAREESQNTTLHKCLVGDVLHQVVDEHLYLLNHKPVKVELNANSKLTYSVNPSLLYMVLANIIRNAFSYTHEGVVTVTIKNKRVTISDTGAGMSEDQMLRMFERKYRNNSSYDRNGIGLSLVKRICDRFGWRIVVNSLKGKGTSVELLLN